jgi:uncharacterized protein YggU (UPF0235/DUF167 family)
MKENRLQYDFFICSSEKDSPKVEQALEQLSGFSVFYPHRDVAQQSGEMFFDVLADALSESKDFILIISPESAKSKWVKIEYQTFFNNFYSVENNRRIFLLKGKDFNMNDVPLFFKNFQISDSVEQIIAKANPIIKSPVTEKARTEQIVKNQDYRKRKRSLKAIVYLIILAIIATGAFVFFDRYGEPVLTYLKSSYNNIFSSEPKVDEMKSMHKPSDEDTPDLQAEDIEKVQQDITLRFDDQSKAVNGQADAQLGEYLKELPEANVINFPNGNKYEGGLKNGLMHGQGVYYYAVRSLISKNDPLERYAEAGSYLLGEWSEGELYMGRLFDGRGEMKERIIIGRK